MTSAALASQQAEMRARIAAAAQPQPQSIPVEKVIAEITEEIANRRSKDVVVYVRHSEECKHIDREDNDKCQCPYWLYDKLNRKRTSARTIRKDEAQKEAQRIMDSRDPLKKKIADLERKREYEQKTISYARKQYIKDCEEGRDLGPETIEAYECAILQLESHCHANGVTMLGEITAELMKNFRSVWPDKEKSSKNKKQRQIKTFFKWVCEQAKYLDLTLNPALALTTIKGEESVPAVPFYDDQFAAIIDATYIYENSKRFRDAAIRLRALILLQRWSGLAIRDALCLSRVRVKNGILQAQRAKTKTWVEIVLPAEVVEALEALPKENPDYFFWNGISKPRSLVGDYNRMFQRLWKLVRWPRPVVDGEGNAIQPHSHMFRHSFAYWWLNTINPATGKLGDIRDLQLLLGHKRLATTEKHYSGFMPEQNKRLHAEMRARHASKAKPEFVQAAPAPEEPDHHVRIRVRQRSHRSR